MATELAAPGAALLPEPPGLEAVSAAAEDEEEHWLYGDDPTGTHGDGPISRHAEASHPLQDAPQESRLGSSKGTEVVRQVLQSEEEDSDSDSDEDDVRVTIGNIKTGAASYMAASMNVNLKTARSYGGSVSAKLPPKGIDLDALGNINGLPVLEVDLDLLEEKPWRKPGADLSDYFNYGFNEDTWKAYREKQRQIQLGLDPTPPLSPEDQVTEYQENMGDTDNEAENNFIQSEFNSEFARIKAGPPPNRKLAGTIDVIGGHSGSMRRVEGRRRESHSSGENPIQVLGDFANNPPPPQQPASQPRPPPPLQQQQHLPPQAPQPQHLPFVTPTGPLTHRPPIIRLPPPHYMHPPPPVTLIHPPMHPAGLPPPNSMRGLFPPPLPPPPTLLMPTMDGSAARYNNNNSRHPPSFGYNSGDGAFINYNPDPTTHTTWVTTAEKATSNSVSSHWQYTSPRRDRERERERDRERERPRTPPRTPPTNEHNRNDEERYHYYSKERSYEYDREYRRSRDHSREQEDRNREHRHKEKEENTKHKSSRRKSHETEEVETHRRHKHKKNKRSKDKAVDDGSPLRDERVIKE